MAYQNQYFHKTSLILKKGKHLQKHEYNKKQAKPQFTKTAKCKKKIHLFGHKRYLIFYTSFFFG